MPFSDFVPMLMRCKVLFVASVSDASPRLIPQALGLNTAIVVNRAIVGGTKYVNDLTGELFTNENDAADVVLRVLHKWKYEKLQPRKWWLEKGTD